MRDPSLLQDLEDNLKATREELTLKSIEYHSGLPRSADPWSYGLAFAIFIVIIFGAVW